LPVTVPAVAVTLASPFASVVAVGPLSVALAPAAGAAKATLTPGTRLPKASLTTTTSGLAKPVATVADCPEPDTTATDAAAPGVLVRAKPADPVPAVAVRV
jgi:hypothetical protein